MKKFIFGLVVFLLSIQISNSYADVSCEVKQAKITGIWAHSDGVTYINIDRNNNCGCGVNNRFGFWRKDPEAKNWLAMAMTAYTTNKNVDIYANNGDCAVIGNTAHLRSFYFGN